MQLGNLNLRGERGVQQSSVALLSTVGGQGSQGPMGKVLRVSLLLLLLALAVVQLSRRMNRLPPATSHGMITYTRVGDSLPALHVRGDLESWQSLLSDVTSEAGCYLVYFFDPGCPACREGATVWAQTPTLKAGGTEVRAIWVDVGDAPEQAIELTESVHFVLPVLHVVDQDPYVAAGISGVPTVWGVQGGSVAYLAQGSTSTQPEALQLTWCTSKGVMHPLQNPAL